MEQSLDVFVEVSDVSLAQVLSNLRQSYEEVLQGPVIVREIPGGHIEVLVDTVASPGIDLEEPLKPTEIMPEIEPPAAFVGDIIYCQGVPTTGDELPDER